MVSSGLLDTHILLSWKPTKGATTERMPMMRWSPKDELERKASIKRSMLTHWQDAGRKRPHWISPDFIGVCCLESSGEWLHSSPNESFSRALPLCSSCRGRLKTVRQRTTSFVNALNAFESRFVLRSVYSPDSRPVIRQQQKSTPKLEQVNIIG